MLPTNRLMKSVSSILFVISLCCCSMALAQNQKPDDEALSITTCVTNELVSDLY